MLQIGVCDQITNSLPVAGNSLRQHRDSCFQYDGRFRAEKYKTDQQQHRCELIPHWLLGMVLHQNGLDQRNRHVECVRLLCLAKRQCRPRPTCTPAQVHDDFVVYVCLDTLLLWNYRVTNGFDPAILELAKCAARGFWTRD